MHELPLKWVSSTMISTGLVNYNSFSLSGSILQSSVYVSVLTDVCSWLIVLENVVLRRAVFGCDYTFGRPLWKSSSTYTDIENVVKKTRCCTNIKLMNSKNRLKREILKIL